MKYLLLITLIALPFFASAYQLLEPLPGEIGPIEGVAPGTFYTFSDYLSWVFKFALAAAAFLAVLMITIGGIQLMVSGASESARGDAKRRIESALWGLLLALGSWLILYTINPDLAKMQLTVPDIKIEVTPTSLLGPLGGDWLYDPGVAAQRNDGSFSLNSLLSCMRDKLPEGAGRISSISDSSHIGHVNDCDKPNCCKGQCNPYCKHECQSCHYGGGTGSGESNAVDFGDQENADALIIAANECGAGYAAKEPKDNPNHVHVSTKDCPKN